MRPQLSLAAVLTLWLAVSTGVALRAPAQEPPVSGDSVARPVPIATRLTRTRFPKYFLDVSPDGTHIAYARQYPHRRATNQILVGLHLVRTDGTDDRRVLTEYDRTVQVQEHPRWSRDGRRLLLSGGGNDTGNAAKDAFVCDVDTDFRVTNLRKLTPGPGVLVGEEPSWSPDGLRVVATTTTEQLIGADSDGKNRSVLLQAGGVYLHQPEWSPDGEWIAFASDRSDDNVEIYKVRRNGQDLTRLTEHPALDSRPRWSPDGQWILFTSYRTGDADVFIMRADGSDARNLTAQTGPDDQAAFMPDGRTFVFVSLRDGGFDIYRAAVPEELQIAAAPPPPHAIPPTVVAGNDAPSAPVSSEGLIAHFDFEKVRDKMTASSVGKLEARVQGATQVTGRVGQGLRFDGQDDLVDFGSPEELKLTTKFSILLWARPERASVEGEPLLFGRGPENWGLTWYTDGKVWSYVAGGGNQLTTHLVLKEWNHIATTFDGKALQLYVNGELREERKSRQPSANNEGPVYSGFDAARKTHFQGDIDEIRVYHRALSAAEVKNAAK